MYAPTARQRSLLDPTTSLPAAAQRRLDGSWARPFRDEVYPLLLREEGRFSDLYAEEGRPNWSVARLVGLMLLQEVSALTDQEALDHLSFDLRWHRALDLPAEDAYLSRRSLVAFRSRLVRGDPEGKRFREVFDAIVRSAMERLQVEGVEARLDSTHIMSNIHTRGRVDLFSSTLGLFVRIVKSETPGELSWLPPDLLAWASDEQEGVFGGWEPGGGKTLLADLARWLVAARDAFAAHPGIRESEPYLLVVRLIDEHIEVVQPAGEPSGGGEGLPSEPVEVRVHKPASPGASMQSPHDPDAGYGHKGPGYEAQIVETCNNKGTELIVDFEVHRSGISDHGKAADAIERLEERDLVPDTLYVDTGYVSAAAIEDATKVGLDLHGPVNEGPLKSQAEILGRDHWEVDPETGRLSHCPQGHPVLRHAERTNPSGVVRAHAYIHGQHCRDCPVASTCLARPPNSGKKGHHHIEDSPDLHLRDRRITEQRTEPWKQKYRIRAGIEATNSELKRLHGLGRLRVRRLPRVKLAVTVKLAACNVKRWMQATPTT